MDKAFRARDTEERQTGLNPYSQSARASRILPAVYVGDKDNDDNSYPFISFFIYLVS